MRSIRIGAVLGVVATVSVVLPGAAVEANGAIFTAPKTDDIVNDDGDAFAEAGEQIAYEVVITDWGNAAADVSLIDTLPDETTFVADSLRTTPIARNDGYHANANIGIAFPASELLANDDDPDGTGAVTFVGLGATAPLNGDVSYSSGTGLVTYLPDPDFTGTDTFTYTVEDGDGNQDTATVSVVVTGPAVWFVDSAGGSVEPGTGTYRDPFTSLAALGAASGPSANEHIVIASGVYPGSITLAAGQRVIGEGVDVRAELTTAGFLHAAKTLLPASTPAGTRPTLATSGGPGVALSTDNWIRGVDILTTPNRTGVSGGAVGNLRITDTSITGNGSPIDITGPGTVAISLDKLTGTSNTAPVVRLTGVSGVFVADDANGLLAATGQRAVEIAGDPTLGLGVSLRSISATGGTSGISLVNTTGAFTVTGDGAAARNGSGGTIISSSGPGVYLDNATGVTLARMNIRNAGDDGIYGEELVGLSLDYLDVSANGNLPGEHGIQLGDRAGGKNGVTGSLRIQNSLIAGNEDSGLVVENQSGTLASFLVESSTIQDHPSGDAVWYRGSGTATVAAGMTNNTFTNATNAVLFEADDTATSSLVLTGSTASQVGRFASFGTDFSASMNFDVSDNASVAVTQQAVRANGNSTAAPFGTLQGRVDDNIITVGATSGLPAIDVRNSGAGEVRATVSNNSIVTTDIINVGMSLEASGSGSSSAGVAGNVISGPGDWPFDVRTSDTATLCADIINNTFPGTIARVRTFDNSTLRLPDFSGTSGPQVVTYLLDRPNTIPGLTVNLNSSINPSSGTCTTPTVPSTPSPVAPAGPAGLPGATSTTPPSAPSFTLGDAGTAGVDLTGSTLTVDLGDFDTGQEATITYRVEVASTLPPTTTQLCNSGEVWANSALYASTDDPDDPTSSADPTCTPALGVNTAPTLTATGSDPSFAEGDAAVGLFSGTAISVGETGQSITDLELTVSGVSDGADEILGVDGATFPLRDGESGTTTTNTMSFAVAVSGSTATVTLTKAGGISSSAAQTLVDAMTYRHAGQAPTDGDRVVTLTSISDDGGTANGGADTRALSVASTVTVGGVNDAPTITAPVSQTIDEDTPTALSGISFGDVDAGTNPLTVTMSVGTGTLTATAGGGVTVAGSGTSSIELAGSVTNLNSFLTSPGVAFTSATNSTAPVTLTIGVDDGGATGSGADGVAAKDVAITVSPVNDAPVNQVPGAQSTAQDTPLTFGSAGSNALAVADVDAGSSDVQLSLTATNGTMTLATTSGLGFTTGDGTADTTIVATGTIAELNAALDGLSFAPTASFAGAASIEMVTNDQGNTGSGGAKSDTDTVAITVLPPAPVVTGVSSTDGTVAIGDTVTISVVFDAPVVVAGGTPTLLLETGTTDRSASYTAGSGTDTLTFQYTVQAGDQSADLDYAGTDALSANGATIRDALDLVDADLTLPTPGGPGSLAASHAIVVDGEPPTGSVVVADPTLGPGQTTVVTITFSEPITGLGLDDFTVPNGVLSGLAASASSARLTQAIGSTTWTATYTPNGDVSAATNTIVLDLSGVTDLAGNAGAGTATSNVFAVQTVTTTTTAPTTTSPTTTAPATSTPTTTPVTGGLPATGGGSSAAIPWALAMLLLGAVGLAVSRRRTV